jgi:Putative addiction module component
VRISSVIMSIPLPLDQKTTADRLRAIEEVWDDLCRNPANVPSPPWHKEVLGDREARIESGEAEFIDWAQAKKDIRDSTQ